MGASVKVKLRHLYTCLTKHLPNLVGNAFWQKLLLAFLPFPHFAQGIGNVVAFVHDALDRPELPRCQPMATRVSSYFSTAFKP